MIGVTTNGLRFGRCELCWHLTSQINNKSTTMEAKLGAVKTYRNHLHDQFVDRSIQWALMELSKDPDSRTLIILVDGMDQAKFRVPKHPQLRAISSMSLEIKITLFNLILSSWCTA